MTRRTPPRLAALLAGTWAALALSGAVYAQSAASPVSEPLAAAAAPQNPALSDRQARMQRIAEQRKGRKPKLERMMGPFKAWETAQLNAQTLETRFDEPQGALTHFLSKRVTTGQTAIGPEDYRPALEQAARMPVHSVRSGVESTVKPSAGSSRASLASTSGAAAATALGGAWQPLGPGNIGGRTRALLIHPTTPSTMWAAGVAGGIWKSTDGGNSWTPKADLLVNIAVNSMMLDPRNPDILYAGTGEGFFNGDAIRGAGILKSTDGGETWAQLASTATPDFFYVQKIVMSKGSSQRLYAATRTGVFRSLDGGTSWARVIDAAAVNGCMDLAIQTDRALANVFASCGTFAQGRVYRALDTAGTQNWVSVLSTPGMGRTSLAIAPSNQNYIYALAASTAAGNYADGMLAVYRSTTGGGAGSWSTRVDNTSPTKLNTVLLSNPVYAFLADCGFGGANQFLNQGWYDNAIAVDPADPNVVWAGGIDLFRSDDGGANWGQASHWWFGAGIDPEYNHADQHIIVFHPQYNGTTNKVMFTGNDGGIRMTSDARAPVSYSPSPVNGNSPVCGNTAPGTVSWTSKNNGYEITQFYHGAVFPNGQTFIGGTQDNGTLKGSTASTTWSTIRGGDGGYVAVNPADTNMLFAENTGLSFQRSTNGGATWTTLTSGITEGAGNFLFITPFTQDPTNAARMYIGGARVWRANNATAAAAPSPFWTLASPFLGARISALAVSPLDANRAYVGTGTGGGTANNGRVWTTNVATTATGATAWTSAQLRADSAYVSWITPDPVAAGTVYATISTFNSATGTGHVFRSTDFGATWTVIDGSGATGLPNVPAHCIVVDPLNTQRLYVGTDIGVFVSTDGGANWARENTGFANVIVESMSIATDAGTRYLVAFSHGRSAFRVALPN